MPKLCLFLKCVYTRGHAEEEQSNKFGFNKSITKRTLGKRSKRLIVFSALIILLLIIGLYVGTFETKDIGLTGGTEYGVCLHLHQFNSSTTIQLIKQANASWIRIDWIPKKWMNL